MLKGTVDRAVIGVEPYGLKLVRRRAAIITIRIILVIEGVGSCVDASHVIVSVFVFDIIRIRV